MKANIVRGRAEFSERVLELTMRPGAHATALEALADREWCPKHQLWFDRDAGCYACAGHLWTLTPGSDGK